MMSDKKIIAIMGATGAQGGGLARAILNDPTSEFAVRAITRDVNSDKARALAAMGAEVVAADVDDVESLKKAFEGAYGAYCVTFFWAHFSPEKEYQQALNMAEAARHAGLKHVIWSTLEDTRTCIPLDDDRMPTLMGKYKVPHFDSKGEANAAFADLPTTYLLASYYWENLIYFGGGPRRNEDGSLVFVLPMDDKPLSGIGSEDIGRCAYGIFKKGTEMVGKSVGLAGDHLSGAEMAAAMSKALGVEIHHYAMPPADYRALGFPGSDDLGNMFQFYRDCNDLVVSTRDVNASRELNPSLQNFDTWLAANKELIPIQ
jgi:uncharacterized protein YbjT (DUF2867 family)